ncbi:SAM-dependent methyltransferase [Candidatus Latescibacterota bacterium]
MQKSLVTLFAVLLIISPLPVVGQEYEYEYDVPYVPTKHEVVAEMLRIADVRENDMLYDLGCGDGRIVITAAEKIGTRGVGIDINPQRISESRENAEKAKVTEKVRFIEQNLFEADFSEATVVALYLLSEVNLRLRPRLLRYLKPGTRVVSHNYHMGDWEPDQTTEVNMEWNNHTVYFWVVPANISGSWEWTLSSGSDEERYYLQLDQHFQQVSGTLTTASTKVQIKDAVLKGDMLQFMFEGKDNKRITTMQFDGQVDGNVIEGIVVSKVGSRQSNKIWKARRDPSTIIPLDISDKR